MVPGYQSVMNTVVFYDKNRIAWMSGEVEVRGVQSSQGSCQDNNHIFVRKTK